MKFHILFFGLTLLSIATFTTVYSEASGTNLYSFSGFSRQPAEIITHQLKFLSPEEITIVGLLNKNLNRISKSEALRIYSPFGVKITGKPWMFWHEAVNQSTTHDIEYYNNLGMIVENIPQYNYFYLWNSSALDKNSRRIQFLKKLSDAIENNVNKFICSKEQKLGNSRSEWINHAQSILFLMYAYFNSAKTAAELAVYYSLNIETFKAEFIPECGFSWYAAKKSELTAVWEDSRNSLWEKIGESSMNVAINSIQNEILFNGLSEIERNDIASEISQVEVLLNYLKFSSENSLNIFSYLYEINMKNLPSPSGRSVFESPLIWARFQLKHLRRIKGINAYFLKAWIKHLDRITTKAFQLEEL